MDKVYGVFAAFGEGDSYTTFDLMDLASTPEKGIELAMEDYTDWRAPKQERDLCHPDMTDETPYVVCKRDDSVISGTTGYNCFGGYIIEEMEVK